MNTSNVNVKNNIIPKIESTDNIVKSWNNNEDSERITWSEYFMSIAILSSSRSPCSRLHVGCVIVKDNRIVSIGYNGFPQGEDHKSFIQVDTNNKPHEMATIHAEQNAICYSAKYGVSISGGSAYITHYPCLNCAKLLLSCGIYNIYYHSDYNNDPLVTNICTKLIITKI
jgi:dCMP deaminase